MLRTLKKIFAVVLAIAVILCTGASLTSNAYYIDYGESGEFEISGIYYGTPGEVSPFDLDDPGVEYDDYSLRLFTMRLVISSMIMMVKLSDSKVIRMV